MIKEDPGIKGDEQKRRERRDENCECVGYSGRDKNDSWTPVFALSDYRMILTAKWIREIASGRVSFVRLEENALFASTRNFYIECRAELCRMVNAVCLPGTFPFGTN